MMSVDLNASVGRIEIVSKHNWIAAMAKLFTFLVFFAIVSAASFGALYMPGPWYEALTKPSWTPSNWLFWTRLDLSLSDDCHCGLADLVCAGCFSCARNLGGWPCPQRALVLDHVRATSDRMGAGRYCIAVEFDSGVYCSSMAHRSHRGASVCTLCDLGELCLGAEFCALAAQWMSAGTLSIIVKPNTEMPAWR